MTDERAIANENISLSSLTRHPVRDRADQALARLLFDLECEGTPPPMLADLLFDYLMIEMQPDDPMTPQDATIWLAQLHRFREALQATIDDIHRTYEEPPC